MKLIYRALCMLVAATATIPHISQARAQIVMVSNLDALPAAVPDDAVSDSWLAQGFTTPTGTSYALASVLLKLLREPAPNFDGTFTVSLWDATATDPLHGPGTELAVINSGTPVSTLSETPTDYTFQASTAITLAPNTSYFIVLQGSVEYALSGLHWSVTDLPNPGSTGIGTMGPWTSNLNQGPWFALTDTYPYQMAVTVVPEPRVYALVSGLILLGLGGLRRFKHPSV